MAVTGGRLTLAPSRRLGATCSSTKPMAVTLLSSIMRSAVCLSLSRGTGKHWTGSPRRRRFHFHLNNPRTDWPALLRQSPRLCLARRRHDRTHRTRPREQFQFCGTRLGAGRRHARVSKTPLRPRVLRGRVSRTRLCTPHLFLFFGRAWKWAGQSAYDSVYSGRLYLF
jgi:hypothetical protein